MFAVGKVFKKGLGLAVHLHLLLCSAVTRIIHDVVSRACDTDVTAVGFDNKLVVGVGGVYLFSVVGQCPVL